MSEKQNESKQTNKKKKKKASLGSIFLRTVLITVVVLLVIGGIGIFIYKHYLYTGDGNFLGTTKDLDPINKTLAVLGVDEDGYRTDVIFVVNYNSESEQVRVISIPRDTYVEWSSEQKARMQELKGYSMSVCKINEMTSYVGIENVRDFTINEIENILGLDIDNYVIITRRL